MKTKKIRKVRVKKEKPVKVGKVKTYKVYGKKLSKNSIPDSKMGNEYMMETTATDKEGKPTKQRHIHLFNNKIVSELVYNIT